MTHRSLLLIFLAGLGCDDVAPPTDDELQAVDADDAPAIHSVKADDGFRQIRQDALSHLIVRGNHLDTATAVTVGELVAEIERGTKLNGVVFPAQALDGGISIPPYFRILSDESGILF